MKKHLALMMFKVKQRERKWDKIMKKYILWLLLIHQNKNKKQ